MVQLDKLKAILALLYEIAELEEAHSPDREKIDRLKTSLRELLAEGDDRGGSDLSRASTATAASSGAS